MRPPNAFLNWRIASASGFDFAAANARVLPSRATTAIEAAVPLMNSRRVFVAPLRVAIWCCTHSLSGQSNGMIWRASSTFDRYADGPEKIACGVT